jgi:chaperone required for assembly of F1-ATPase
VSRPTSRRFWTAATAVACEQGFTVHLDGRALKTPAKAPLVVPTLALAAAIAGEWQARVGHVDPASMPLTRMANSAIDKIAPQMAGVVAEVAGFGATDLLCYRSDGPEALVARQAAGWDPVLEWVAQMFDAPLVVTTGVIPVQQPPASVEWLSAQVAMATPFALAGLHDLVAISGSLVLGLAVSAGRLTPEQAFELSRIDEHWQAELWGRDDEAAAAEADKRQAMKDAGRFLELYRRADA